MWPINDISIWNQWASKEAQPIFSNKTGTGSSSTQIRWTVYVSSWIKKKAVQRSNYTTQVLINVWINHENSWLGLTLRHPLYCYLLFQLNSGLFNYVLPLSSHSWMPCCPKKKKFLDALATCIYIATTHWSNPDSKSASELRSKPTN